MKGTDKYCKYWFISTDYYMSGKLESLDYCPAVIMSGLMRTVLLGPNKNYSFRLSLK